jgi:hypothetical protein
VVVVVVVVPMLFDLDSADLTGKEAELAVWVPSLPSCLGGWVGWVGLWAPTHCPPLLCISCFKTLWGCEPTQPTLPAQKQFLVGSMPKVRGGWCGRYQAIGVGEVVCVVASYQRLRRGRSTLIEETGGQRQEWVGSWICVTLNPRDLLLTTVNPTCHHPEVLTLQHTPLAGRMSEFAGMLLLPYRDNLQAKGCQVGLGRTVEVGQGGKFVRFGWVKEHIGVGNRNQPVLASIFNWPNIGNLPPCPTRVNTAWFPWLQCWKRAPLPHPEREKPTRWHVALMKGGHRSDILYRPRCMFTPQVNRDVRPFRLVDLPAALAVVWSRWSGRSAYGRQPGPQCAGFQNPAGDPDRCHRNCAR